MSSATDKEKEIHALVLLKDDLAFAKLCDAYFETVYQKVTAFNPGIYTAEETLIADVVTDTFMKYFQDPHRYKPEKLSLQGFLVMDAQGDLKNAWEKLKRQAKKSGKVVGLGPENGNMIEDIDPGPIETMINKETAGFLDQKLKELFQTEQDQQVAQLLLSGERRSAEYARLLKIEHLDPEMQGLEIKRCKDRIDKTIKRKFGKTL